MKRKSWIIVGILAAGLVFLPVIVPMFAPWTSINCRHQEINIKTGQARYSRCLWFMKVSQRVEPTLLSVSLQGDTVDVVDIKPWHRVNTFSPGIGHSPHYIFHSALSQVEGVRTYFSMTSPDLQTKHEVASTILELWQESGRDSGADNYIDSLLTKVYRELEPADGPDRE